MSHNFCHFQMRLSAQGGGASACFDVMAHKRFHAQITNFLGEWLSVQRAEILSAILIFRAARGAVL
jgi:hypothetical protein